MSEEYPLYPKLSEYGEEEAAAIFEGFKKKMEALCKETLSQLYTDVAAYIESDSWTNFRNDLLDGFRNYGNRKLQADYDFKTIRSEIYKQFRDDIIKDLNQDLVTENESLKAEIQRMYEFNRRY